MVEKAVNVEAKASLQPLFKTRKIYSRYLKGYRPLAKKNKDKANQKHWEENKANPHNLSLININQPLTQVSKKNKRH